MEKQPNADATNLDLREWEQYVHSLDVSPLFVTVSGAHIYGFPSPDSDVDLRGCHQLKLANIVGLSRPTETIDRSGFHNGIEVDLVSHDIGKYFALLVKNNGYILEQVFSPLVVKGQEFLDKLRPLAKNCITKNHYFHYRGFFGTQLKLIEKQNPVTAKAVLYAYRVLCTGIHLMQTGVVETDLRVLAKKLNLDFIEELIAAKVAEKVEFKFDLDHHLQQLTHLENEMENAYSNSELPENPQREPVNDFLVQLRLTGGIAGIPIRLDVTSNRPS